MSVAPLASAAPQATATNAPSLAADGDAFVRAGTPSVTVFAGVAFSRPAMDAAPDIAKNAQVTASGCTIVMTRLNMVRGRLARTVAILLCLAPRSAAAQDRDARPPSWSWSADGNLFFGYNYQH